jgi:hypothetical protein
MSYNCTNLVSNLSRNYASKLHFITLFDNLGNLDYPKTFKPRVGGSFTNRFCMCPSGSHGHRTQPTELSFIKYLKRDDVMNPLVISLTMNVARSNEFNLPSWNEDLNSAP